MAGPYYVDLSSPGAWNARDGLSAGACWLGITGLQNAFDRVLKAEICYVAGTGDLSKFYAVTYDASSGTTLTDGEEVTWDTGEGAWGDGSDKGIVRVAVSTAGGSGTVEIELTVGTMPADNDVLKGTTSTQTITRAATANANKTLDVDTNAGENGTGFIKFIGVNALADTTVRTTRAIIDANEAGVHIITFTGTADYYWFENIEVMDCHGAAKNGFYASAAGSGGFVFINCCAHECSGAGFYLSNNMTYSYFIRCVSYTNTGFGFQRGTYNKFILCCANGNTDSGFDGNSALISYIGCISHGNGDDGIESMSLSGFAFNCVFDGNTDNGVTVLSATDVGQFPVLIGCRFTNHSQAGTDAGLDCNSEVALLGFNYFEDNGDDPEDNVINDTVAHLISEEGTVTDSNRYSQADTNEGYAEAVANHNFATGYVDASPDPHLRRTAITIPWT